MKDKQTNPRPNSQPEAEIIWIYTHKEAEFPHTSKKFSQKKLQEMLGNEEFEGALTQ